MSTIPSSDFRDDEKPHPWKVPSVSELYPSGVPQQLVYPNIAASQLLARSAARFPDRIAAEFFQRQFSYQEIDQAATKLAAWLQARELHSGARVGVLLPNCPEYLISLNAIWRAGAVAVSVSPLSVHSDVQRLLKLTDCKAIINLDMLEGLLASSDLDHRLSVSLQPYLPQWKQFVYRMARWQRTRKIRFSIHTQQTSFWDAVEQSSGALSPAEIIPSKDPAYILSTGGTTGAPKAVTLSHRNIVANAWQQVHWIGGVSQSEQPQETMLSVLPFFHSYGMSTMLASGTALGARLVMQPRFSVSTALKAITTRRPTIFHAVPAMLAAINQRLRVHRGRNPFDLSSLKWVISGGAALPVEVGSEFAHHSGAQVVEGYGLSEASPVTHVGPLDGSNQFGTIGLPLPDTECRIVALHDPKKELPSGEVGELLIRAPQVMLGYWKNQQATAQILQDGWLRTGDLARRNARGFYQIVDRKKDLIITSGFNVYPADVEQVLRECDDVADVAVIGVPDESRGEIVKAFVVLNKGVRWNKSKLERFCKSRLAKHRRPRLWEHVKDDLPRNFLGKVIRRELRLSQDRRL